MRTDVPDEPGWHRTADLLEDEQRLRAVVAEGAAALATTHAGAQVGVRTTVSAAVLLSDWCWALAAVGAGALVADGRVPDLDPAGVWLRVQDGRVTGVALTSGALVPDGDRDAALRGTLSRHLARLHVALRSASPPLLRRGPRAMWGAAGDGVATALRLQAPQAEHPDALLDAAERLLAGAPESWGRHGFDRAAPDGPRRPRTSCCLWYRLDAPECATCPRTAARSCAVAAG